MSINFIINFSLIIFEIQKINIILIIIDHFIKYIVLIFIYSNINTAELTELIYNYIDIRFGLSLNIVFDRSFIFINKFWSNFYYYNKINIIYRQYIIFKLINKRKG